MFKIFKELKELNETLKESEAEAQKYCAMTDAEVAALSDEEFLSAMHCRIFDKVEKEGIDALSQTVRIYFVVASYDFDHFEYAKSSIDDMFTGEEFKYATELPTAFEAVGAAAYKDLLCKFVKQNGLDLGELQGMSDRELRKALRKCKTFSGKDFDSQYEALEERKPLSELADTYLIANRQGLI